MSTLGALGIDVGPHTGIAAAWWDLQTWELLDAVAFECRAEDSAARLRDLLASRDRIQVAGIEAFVARNKAVRLAGVQTARVMGQVRELTVILHEYGVPCVARPAGLVKPWGTGKRLAAAGLLVPGDSAHILDAKRHMLFSACAAGLPDPLSALMACPCGRGDYSACPVHGNAASDEMRARPG